MKIRIVYNYILFRLGIRHILPAYFIRKIRVQECDEPIVKLSDNSTILSVGGQELLGRKSVIHKLERISAKLEKRGMKLLIYELYRSVNRQEQMRQEQMLALQSQYPELPDDEIVKMTDKRVSSAGGGHQTGGAVDLTICSMGGIPLDMGGAYLEFSNRTETYSNSLTQQQYENRKLLNQLMAEEGFVNYPAEWWHFSYGDKMWAAYSNKKVAFYDIISSKMSPTCSLVRSLV